MIASDTVQNQLHIFRSGGDLALDDPPVFLDALLAEQDEQLLAAVLTAWTKKGVTEDELFALASIMRQRCTRVESAFETFADIVGTGGSKVKTFNVSTAAAFVVAGAGIPVAKHGNRAATSSTGSADVLSELGVQPAVDAVTAERCLAELGICFIFAPHYHRLSPVLGKVRRDLGFPTIFNILGPLCNPAFPPHQLIGVWDSSLVAVTARVLARLGTRRSWIVSGADGLDEITLSGSTHAALIKNDEVQTFEIEPQDFGVSGSGVGSIRSRSPAESAALIHTVLSGETADGAASKLVLMSAAATIQLVEQSDLQQAFAKATESVNSGSALSKLHQLASMTNE